MRCNVRCASSWTSATTSSTYWRPSRSSSSRWMAWRRSRSSLKARLASRPARGRATSGIHGIALDHADDRRHEDDATAVSAAGLHEAAGNAVLHEPLRFPLDVHGTEQRGGQRGVGGERFMPIEFGERGGDVGDDDLGTFGDQAVVPDDGFDGHLVQPGLELQLVGRRLVLDPVLDGLLEGACPRPQLVAELGARPLQLGGEARLPRRRRRAELDNLSVELAQLVDRLLGGAVGSRARAATSIGRASRPATSVTSRPASLRPCVRAGAQMRRWSTSKSCAKPDSCSSAGPTARAP